ncbi:MAG: putative secreted protein, partial [uncultured Chloroflexia bacterium]
MDLILALVLVLIVAAGAFLLFRRRKSDQIRSKFGPEYERALEETGKPAKAEAALREREQRVSKFNIHPLDAADRDRFVDTWTRIQSDFVDDPKGAVSRADALLGDVMSARGYPVTDFEQRSSDLSVDHPVVVQNYRSAHDIALRHARGEAGTEDLRQAMIHFREL